MSLRIVTVTFAVLLLAVPIFAREHSDVIVMTNGDRLTGEIKGISAGVLYASLDYVDGTISIQWSKVARLESTQPFIVKTEDGAVHSGTLTTVETPAGEPIKIQVTGTSQKEAVVLEQSRIVKVDQTSEKFWQRLNGAINFGTIYSKGNQATQYNLSTETEYLQERWRAKADFSSNLSSSNHDTPATRNQLSLSALRLLPWENYFYSGLGTFLQSSEQGISLQTNIGAGIGRYLKNTNRTSISVLGGFAWQGTSYKQTIVPIARQNIAAAVIAGNVQIFKFKRTNLSLTASVFPAISERGRVFYGTNATYYIKLLSNLSWNLSFYGNWDNDPPANLPGSDYGSSSGLSWTFGNR
jgi:hypothetical protein